MAAGARFDAEIRKKQAIIQAKKRKRQELTSPFSSASSVLSSRHSHSHAEQVLSQLAQRSRATELGAPTFKIVGSGKPSRAAVGSGHLQNQERKGDHCSKSAEPRPSVGAAMEYWLGIEPVESKESFRMPAHSQIKLSKESSFFMVSGLEGAFDAGRRPAVKTETEPKHEMSTGDTTVGRPHVKTELSMPGDQGREQRCPPDFEGVTPIPYDYAAEVGHGTSKTQRHDLGDTLGP